MKRQRMQVDEPVVSAQDDIIAKEADDDAPNDEADLRLDEALSDNFTEHEIKYLKRLLGKAWKDHPKFATYTAKHEQIINLGTSLKKPNVTYAPKKRSMAPVPINPFSVHQYATDIKDQMCLMIMLRKRQMPVNMIISLDLDGRVLVE